MRNKFNILFIVFAYLLNITHDLQPHEHITDEIKHLIYHQIDSHNHNNNAENHHNTNDNSDDHHEIPFPHSHLLQSHDLIQIRTLQSSTQQLDYPETSKTIFCFRLPEPIQIDTFQSDEKNFYLTQTGLSLGLRAPPVLS